MFTEAIRIGDDYDVRHHTRMARDTSAATIALMERQKGPFRRMGQFRVDCGKIMSVMPSRRQRLERSWGCCLSGRLRRYCRMIVTCVRQRRAGSPQYQQNGCQQDCKKGADIFAGTHD